MVMARCPLCKHVFRLMPVNRLEKITCGRCYFGWRVRDFPDSTWYQHSEGESVNPEGGEY